MRELSKMKNKVELICAACICVCAICISLIVSVVVFVKSSEYNAFLNKETVYNNIDVVLEELDEKQSYKEDIIAKINNDYQNINNIDIIIDTIIDKAKKYDINWTTAFSIVEMESCFNYKATRNGKGNDVSKGLTQITPLCLEEYNKKTDSSYCFTDMENIEKSLEVGFWYLRFLLDKYDHIMSEKDAIIAYNVGPSRLRKMTASDKATYNTRRNKIYNKWSIIFG